MEFDGFSTKVPATSESNIALTSPGRNSHNYGDHCASRSPIDAALRVFMIPTLDYSAVFATGSLRKIGQTHTHGHQPPFDASGQQPTERPLHVGTRRKANSHNHKITAADCTDKPAPMTVQIDPIPTIRKHFVWPLQRGRWSFIGAGNDASNLRLKLTAQMEATLEYFGISYYRYASNFHCCCPATLAGR